MTELAVDTLLLLQVGYILSYKITLMTGGGKQKKGKGGKGVT